MILSASSLTDELTDDEARPLIQWGLSQAEAAADDLTQAHEISGDLAGGDLRAILADRLDPVRRAMKCINSLAFDRRRLAAEELFEELQNLFTLSERLPCPPLLDVSVVPLTELSARQADLENLAFVRAIVDLLESPSG